MTYQVPKLTRAADTRLAERLQEAETALRLIRAERQNLLEASRDTDEARAKARFAINRVLNIIDTLPRPTNG